MQCPQRKLQASVTVMYKCVGRRGVLTMPLRKASKQRVSLSRALVFNSAVYNMYRRAHRVRGAFHQGFAQGRVRMDREREIFEECRHF